MPHTVTFIDDFARALTILGSGAEALGEMWHVPSAETVTFRRFVEMIGEQMGHPARLSVAPPWTLAVIGLVNPDLRAVREILYQNQEPWIVDHSQFERTFGADPTPHPQAIRTTLEWFSRVGSSRR